MPWFKVDDGLWSHPKFAALSDAAQALWLRAGAYSADKLTDGFVDQQILVTLLRGKPKVIDELVASGLWVRRGKGVAFHDWSDYQPTAESVKSSREQARERMAKVRANKRRSSHSPGPGPDPVPRTDDYHLSLNRHLSNAREGIDEDWSDLGVSDPGRVVSRIAAVVGDLPESFAVDVARRLLADASTVVLRPDAYVEACDAESIRRAFESFDWPEAVSV